VTDRKPHAPTVEHDDDLADGAEIDRVKDDIRAGRDAMVPFRVEDYD
jgi:predicted neutral ceramidase superfamily lipid hydrolase